MRQALVTIVAPLALERMAQARAAIDGLGNPASAAIRAALEPLDGEAGVHFVSLHALTASDGKGGHLILEFSADGDEATALPSLARRLSDQLKPIFRLARDWPNAGDLTRYLRGHQIAIGFGWMGSAGLAFAGSPGMSVGRIRGEAALAARVAALLEGQGQGLDALTRLLRVREALAGGDFAWALATPPAPTPVPPPTTTLGLIRPLLWSFIATYLWPVGVLIGLTALGVGLWKGLEAAAMALIAGAIVGLVVVLAALTAVYFRLRALEAGDWTAEAGPDRAVLAEILARENHGAQNHMVSATVLKPGLTRMFTVRLAFWLIAGLARLSFRPGFLGDIGTIHFARWITVPGTREFIFFSNYGGSWESYLEDFITKAHNGLTAVWSNCVGFPRANNLFQDGATDGERFKRFARRSMVPTRFWYGAYPHLTTTNIRENAAIRRGLAVAMTDEEAGAWLALFGSAPRPAEKLETPQIQSLVFGGLGFMPHGRVLLIDLGEDGGAAKAWLTNVLPHVAFGDGRQLRRDAVVTLGLAPGALARLGLPAAAIETFPPAYLDGMTGPGRDRILGDDDRGGWWWGAAGAHDAALLVYGVSEASVAALCADLARLRAPAREMALETVHAAAPDRKEPFGFMDGISQPVIRGTYQGLRAADPIHLVEPGEFILGYPDNRGNRPPGPTLAALGDPGNLLPIDAASDAFARGIADAPRDIGRNGSFLVIRQLEQDVAAFEHYCESEARRLAGRFAAPYVVTPEFIGAKLVGRWKNGSSIVRNAYQPQAASQAGKLRRATSNPADGAAIAPPPAPAAKAVHAGGPDVSDNDFLFGTEDPEALRCPYGAHIRRSNPRDSLDPGSNDQIAISNRHRILRVGRPYAPAAGGKPGLMFMCLNGDIERQFEFVQQTWIGSPTFQGLAGETDPIAGAGETGFTIPTRDGPVALAPMSRFTTVRGGGYYFMPGRKLAVFLAG